MAKKKGGKNRSGQAGPKSTSKRPPAPSPAPEPEKDEQEKDSEETDAPQSPPPAEKDSPPLPKESESSDAEPDVAPPPPKSKHTEVLWRAPWGKPFVGIEKWWTWLELRLLVTVVLGLIASMVFWVGIQGLSSPVESDSKAGVVFRGIIGLVGLGTLTWFVTGRLKTNWLVRVLGTDLVGAMFGSRREMTRVSRTVATVLAMTLGVVLAPKWRSVGVIYFGNVQNWLQEGSTFTMIGQLRGVSTRLTVVVAFIGGSLAAASGKHINIDVALRFIPRHLRLPVFVTQNLATITVCLVASWGFFDYIAISNFNASTEMTASEKYKVVDKAVSQDMFLLRRQIIFDLKAAPYVIRGTGVEPETDPDHRHGAKWDDDRGFNGRKWNELLETSGYRDYFTADEVEALKAPDDYLDESRLPLAIGPEGQPRNLLVRTMNLTFSAGFIFMALRFLLRLILVVSGHQSMEPEEEFDPDADAKRHEEREKAALIAAKETSGKEIV